MKLLGHIHHLLLICTYLTYLIIMTNGYPLRPNYCSLYVPDDNFVVDEPNSPIATKPVLFFGERFVEDSSSNDLIKPSESNIILKKKNSEIISALMGLRRAMSNKSQNAAEVQNTIIQLLYKTKENRHEINTTWIALLYTCYLYVS